MSISGIEAAGFTPYVAPTLSSQGLSGVAGASGTPKVADTGQEFGHLVVDGLDRLQSVQQKSDGLAVKAATGDLDAMHQYTIAATEASVSTQLTVALRNKAIEAFNEILRMPVG